MPDTTEYRLPSGKTVRVEYDPGDGWEPAVSGYVAGDLADAVAPGAEAAAVLLGQAGDGAAVCFGLHALPREETMAVSRSPGEGAFQVTVRPRPRTPSGRGSAARDDSQLEAE